MKRIETIILENLLYGEEFVRKALPFIKEEYFLDESEKIVFRGLSDFINKYTALPTKEALGLQIKSNKNLTDEQFKRCGEIVKELGDEKQVQDWLLKETEAFCKEKSLYNAILESIHIIDGKSKDKTPAALPDILSKALAVSFETSVGHDYLENADSRYEFYHKTEDRIPFDLDLFNQITRGGLKKKTLTIALAGTNVGKSLFMCNLASHCLSIGKNVLYITLEMAEEYIAQRIDANLMDITIDDLEKLPKDIYRKKIERIREKTKGNLIVKEYPTSSASTSDFKILLEELKLKKNFKPDIVFVDYINICSSSRMKMNANLGTYTYIKSIAEELRGLAVQYAVPIFSATQTNRTGFTSTDVGLENTSESFGLPATADLMFAMISTEELEKLNQILIKQLKNRYSSVSTNKRFVIGINRGKMKLFDLEQSAQSGLVDTTPPPKPSSFPAAPARVFRSFPGKSDGEKEDSKFKGWKL